MPKKNKNNKKNKKRNTLDNLMYAAVHNGDMATVALLIAAKAHPSAGVEEGGHVRFLAPQHIVQWGDT